MSIQNVHYVKGWIHAINVDGVLTVRHSALLPPEDPWHEPVKDYMRGVCRSPIGDPRQERDPLMMHSRAWVDRFRVWEQCPGVAIAHTCIHEMAEAA